MSITVTIKEMIEKVRELASRDPEARKECKYTVRNEEGKLVPECIMGHALVELGLDISVLHSNFFGSISYTLYSLYYSSDIPFQVLPKEADSASSYWLSSVQRNQDGGATWKDAVEMADHAYPSVLEEVGS